MAALWPCQFNNGRWEVSETHRISEPDDVFTTADFPKLKSTDATVFLDGHPREARLYIELKDDTAFAVVEDVWPDPI